MTEKMSFATYRTFQTSNLGEFKIFLFVQIYLKFKNTEIKRLHEIEKTEILQMWLRCNIKLCKFKCEMRKQMWNEETNKWERKHRAKMK